jgi:hypothetical protein
MSHARNIPRHELLTRNLGDTEDGPKGAARAAVGGRPQARPRRRATGSRVRSVTRDHPARRTDTPRRTWRRRTALALDTPQTRRTTRRGGPRGRCPAPESPRRRSRPGCGQWSSRGCRRSMAVPIAGASTRTSPAAAPLPGGVARAPVPRRLRAVRPDRADRWPPSPDRRPRRRVRGGSQALLRPRPGGPDARRDGDERLEPAGGRLPPGDGRPATGVVTPVRVPRRKRPRGARSARHGRFTGYPPLI